MVVLLTQAKGQAGRRPLWSEKKESWIGYASYERDRGTDTNTDTSVQKNNSVSRLAK
jgi:hypothetical protein